MIELRWYSDDPSDFFKRRLQYRYRLGGVGINLSAGELSATGIAHDPNEGWSPWVDVPVIWESQ